jgi:hypothetical protein
MADRLVALRYPSLSKRISHVIARPDHAFHLRAAGAAKNLIFGLDAMPDDSAPAVRARGGHGMNRAFKAVEDVPLAELHDLE